MLGLKLNHVGKKDQGGPIDYLISVSIKINLTLMGLVSVFNYVIMSAWWCASSGSAMIWYRSFSFFIGGQDEIICQVACQTTKYNFCKIMSSSFHARLMWFQVPLSKNLGIYSWYKMGLAGHVRCFKSLVPFSSHFLLGDLVNANPEPWNMLMAEYRIVLALFLWYSSSSAIGLVYFCWHVGEYILDCGFGSPFFLFYLLFISLN